MIKKVVGLVGPIASGKGTVSQYLCSKGYKSYPLSDRIREEIKSRSQEVTRESLNQTSNELREKFGPEILAQRTAELIGHENPQRVVIDGMRNPAEVKYFKTRFNMLVIALFADQKKRYRLFINRKLNSQPMTFEEFKELDDKELNGSLGEKSQRVADSMEMADVTIINEGTFDDLDAKVDSAISAFYGSQQ